jgi:hypothetical protein
MDLIDDKLHRLDFFGRVEHTRRLAMGLLYHRRASELDQPYFFGVSLRGNVPEGSSLQDLTSYSWGNEIVADDEEKRSIVVAAMASSAYVVGIWLILIIWKQTDGPKYHKGFITASVFSVLAVIFTLIVRELVKRDNRR